MYIRKQARLINAINEEIENRAARGIKDPARSYLVKFMKAREFVEITKSRDLTKDFLNDLAKSIFVKPKAKTVKEGK